MVRGDVVRSRQPQTRARRPRAAWESWWPCTSYPGRTTKSKRFSPGPRKRPHDRTPTASRRLKALRSSRATAMPCLSCRDRHRARHARQSVDWPRLARASHRPVFSVARVHAGRTSGRPTGRRRSNTSLPVQRRSRSSSSARTTSGRPFVPHAGSCSTTAPSSHPRRVISASNINYSFRVAGLAHTWRGRRSSYQELGHAGSQFGACLRGATPKHPRKDVACSCARLGL